MVNAQQKKELKEMYNTLSSETKEAVKKIFGEGVEEVINNPTPDFYDLIRNSIKTAINNER